MKNNKSHRLSAHRGSEARADPNLSERFPLDAYWHPAFGIPESTWTRKTNGWSCWYFIGFNGSGVGLLTGRLKKHGPQNARRLEEDSLISCRLWPPCDSWFFWISIQSPAPNESIQDSTDGSLGHVPIVSVALWKYQRLPPENTWRSEPAMFVVAYLLSLISYNFRYSSRHLDSLAIFVVVESNTAHHVYIQAIQLDWITIPRSKAVGIMINPLIGQWDMISIDLIRDFYPSIKSWILMRWDGWR